MAENVKAALFGCALGEAYGSAFAASEMPLRGPRWTIGCNTQLMLATCEGILSTGEVKGELIARSILEWHSRGWIMNPEPATLMSLLELASGKEHKQTGQRGQVAASNGAIIRTAVAGLLLDPSLENDRLVLREICRITHQNDDAYAAALAIVLAIRLIRNEKQNFIPLVIRSIPDSGVKERLVAIGKNPGISIKDIGRRFGATSNVVDSVPLVLYAAQHSHEKEFIEVLKDTVKVGGEITSNSAITGMISGYCLGMENMPREWIDRLREVPGFNILERIATDFEKLVEGKKGVVTLF